MAAQQAEKIALGLSKYIKPIPRPFNRNTTEQMNEYYGLGDFHCKAHEELSSSQQALNSQYKVSDLSKKREIAKHEIQIWQKYIDSRLNDLPEEFKLSNSTQARLHKLWALSLHRNTDSIEGARMLDFHYKFTEHFTFDVPMDKRSLFEMIHPHAGYMVTIPYRFTFNKLIEFYKIQLVASYERSLGEELLSRQISCFNYFIRISEESELLDMKKINELMTTFKFPEFGSLKEFRKYFDWTLKDFPEEFAEMSETQFFMRFALARKIFLDYNL